MDRASVDIGVLFPTHVSSYCALRDGGFENALYRAYHRWVADFCAQAPTRLKWTVVANMRDVAAGVAEIKYWAERDPNLVGVYVSPQAPGGRLLDNPDLYPLYDAAQALDLPILAHGGTARPPYGPGTFDLDGAWFLLHGFSNPWAGMAALGALIGGGIFELFPRLRAAIIETGGGWMPLALDRLDTHYLMSPGHVPNLKRMPREVLAEGRYFHGIDSWERSLEFCVEELGEDLWLFATDWPHGDSRLAGKRRADRRSPAPHRERPQEDPRRERDAPLPAPARLTRPSSNAISVIGAEQHMARRKRKGRSPIFCGWTNRSARTRPTPRKPATGTAGRPRTSPRSP